MHLRYIIPAVLALAMAASADVPRTALDAPFQVGYAANLNRGESYINIINDGANGAPAFGPGFGEAIGTMCVNVYAFDPNEELISCCSCLITPDQVITMGVNRHILSNTTTPVVPTSVTIKLLGATASSQNVTAGCTNTAAIPGTFAPGLVAFMTTLHAAPGGTYATTEKPFRPATLSTGEIASVVNRCAGIIGDLGGFGICLPCRRGAQRATRM